MSSVDLLTLQGNIKKDPDGYKDEFQLQLQHYEALLDVFKLKPSRESKEFGDLAMFLAQVSLSCLVAQWKWRRHFGLCPIKLLPDPQNPVCK
ncbi:hypothetical protein DUNSADRAFT_8135 [Dunaliella salina]|uniref:Protein SDA1 n=1 Tax=Dunaliella salina TaxID=3046 RepID=A0ABQ7FU81_DUNSA|nr:hypothetical protein DUNSADRAFT_8135 [Dunaliella salina]|eukprot:KAF5825611.1 hypothetical protein DUNSADRAFT_8135 [Dunaliella salina]